MRYRIILVAVAMALGLAGVSFAACPYNTVWPSCTVQYPGGDNLEDERDIHRDYAFASLPTCGSGFLKFTIAFVNDASAAGTCDGGGSAMSLCGCDGVSWVALGGGGGTHPVDLSSDVTGNLASPTFTGTSVADHLTIGGKLDLGAFTSINTDTTPSVGDTNLLLANEAVTITDFDDGVIGQAIIVVLNTIGDVTFACSGAPLVCNGSTDIVATTGDVLTWINNSGNSWHLQSYDKGLIEEADLFVSNSPTDNDVMTYNLAGKNFTWVAQSSIDANAASITDGIIVEADLDDNSQTPTDGDFLAYASAGTDFIWKTGDLLGSDLTSTTNDITSTHTGKDILFEVTGKEDFEFNFQNSNKINVLSNTAVNKFDFNAISVVTDSFMAHGLQATNTPTGGVKTIGATQMSMNMYFTTETSGDKLTYKHAASVALGNYYCVHDTHSGGDLGIRPHIGDAIHLPGGLVLADGNEADGAVGSLPIRFCMLALDDKEI